MRPDNTTSNAQTAAVLTAQQQQVMDSLRQLCSNGDQVSQSTALQVHLALLADIELARLVLNGECTYGDLGKPELNVHFVEPTAAENPAISADVAGQLYAAAHAIAVERAEKLNAARDAFKRNDIATVVRIARELCGISEEEYEARDRADSRIN